MCATVKKCIFEGCLAQDSEKGGMGRMKLNVGGELQLEECSVRACGCNIEYGKGGGMFVESEEEGALKFVFRNCLFEGNMGWKGKDIFVSCINIEKQINENQFELNAEGISMLRDDSICGTDKTEHVGADVDLMKFISVFKSRTIIVSGRCNCSGGEISYGADERQCGAADRPCATVEYGASHLCGTLFVVLGIDGESSLNGPTILEEMTLRSVNSEYGKICFGSEDGNSLKKAEKNRDFAICARGNVIIELIWMWIEGLKKSSYGCIVASKEGLLTMRSCKVSGTGRGGGEIAPKIMECIGGSLKILNVSVTDANIVRFVECRECMVELTGLHILNIEGKEGLMFSDNAAVSLKEIRIENSKVDSGSYVKVTESIDSSLHAIQNTMLNLASLSMANISSNSCEIAMIEQMGFCIQYCLRTARFKDKNEANLLRKNSKNIYEELCEWDGWLISAEDSSVKIRDSTLTNAQEGGLTVKGGKTLIEECEFTDIKAEVNNYRSARRNMHCSEFGELNVESLKRGDGRQSNTSLWILNEGCELEGIAKDRLSPYYIATLDSVHCSYETSGYVTLHFIEIWTNVPIETIASTSEEVEVSVAILNGSLTAPISTKSITIKNGSSPAHEQESEKDKESDIQTEEDQKLQRKQQQSFRDAEGNLDWKSCLLIAMIIIVIGVIVGAGVVVKLISNQAAREKQKLKEYDSSFKESEMTDEGNVAFEMVTMGILPESYEDYSEGEKYEPTKKCSTVLKYQPVVRSESQQHLVDETSSAQLLNNLDSRGISIRMINDEISGKNNNPPSFCGDSPTPPLSPQFLNSMNDATTTFVRIEDECPTTSSMSNLVDAMACSSPHEKLIVDLRDSLFMLLHGLNKTKEMPIGTLKEREMTAAQILFWVANLALHSFDEMENELSSLADLSPHIVLFSEHMVICIAMHSDCFFDSDSDSSSISSSTVATSASDDDEEDSLPSSAFEDENDFKKECMRWKAPELLINKKMGATKESVSFSIGMMLWECLSLQIPFGEYEAATAGQKIANGERPQFQNVVESELAKVAKSSLCVRPEKRPSLKDLKKEFIQRFPSNATIPNVSDAVSYDCIAGDSLRYSRTSCKSNQRYF
ncbi:uncharacterized protein MONOS_18124 [Monocercomonoides exilis]|uniref:uncharacterized protein n=1 Tax=Monocercomonoides exilis TaxID=2049356 RepID=UPI0035594276|nr:hypothetical protein MONOS_18124 [Monocercomonoides exilis]